MLSVQSVHVPQSLQTPEDPFLLQGCRDQWKAQGCLQPRPTSLRSCPFLTFAHGWRGQEWDFSHPAIHLPQHTGLRNRWDQETLCDKMRKPYSQDKDDSRLKCYLGPVLIVGLNHFPLPANGMRDCTGFPGVLHLHLFRLVTDALPWKPALGKKKTIPGTGK